MEVGGTGITFNKQHQAVSQSSRLYVRFDISSLHVLGQVILTSLDLSFLTCDCEDYDRPAVFKITMGEVKAKY